MSKEKFDLLEVKTKEDGLYLVTLYHFNEKKRIKEYSKEWLRFENNKWLYKAREDCLVCFIHERKEDL
tara:strand:+ start:1795 stop:1998 length:204 start_codon:yes stop_codon:yes gene_type:complete